MFPMFGGCAAWSCVILEIMQFRNRIKTVHLLIGLVIMACLSSLILRQSPQVGVNQQASASVIPKIVEVIVPNPSGNIKTLEQAEVLTFQLLHQEVMKNRVAHKFTAKCSFGAGLLFADSELKLVYLRPKKEIHYYWQGDFFIKYTKVSDEIIHKAAQSKDILWQNALVVNYGCDITDKK